MTFGVIETILAILLIALVVTVALKLLKLPIVLGYVMVGAIVGPNVLNWLQNSNMIKDLAEFGVALLLFTIGLDFSLPKLYAIRHTAFFLGGLQVSISIIVTTIIGVMLKIPVTSAIVMGAIVAMSSTAIVLKQLIDQNELIKPHGTNAISILLFQDFAVIPVLVFIASLSLTSEHSFPVMMLIASIKGIVAILLIFTIAHWLLRPLFRFIANAQLKELFTLCVLFVAVGSAWLTNLFGLSYALGAFLAGIMLAESEHRQQIKSEILPFRDLLLGLFFISIGMLVNLSAWPKIWMWIVLLVIGLVIAKPLLIFALCKLAKNSNQVALQTSLILAEGGEFGFAILSVALTQELLPYSWSQSILGALLISFILSPIIIRYNTAVAKHVFSL